MKVSLSDDNKKTLEQWLKSRVIGIKQKQRAKIILMTAAGLATAELMAKLQVRNPTLNLCRNRYVECGVAGLVNGKSRAPGTPRLEPAKVQEILTLTLTGTPVAASPWSCRSLAERVGVSRRSVKRVGRAYQLKPHRVKGVKVSTDPLFAEKLKDVIGLYLEPPEKALVFSVDEKSQRQALDRSQPGLPIKRGSRDDDAR